MYNLCQSHFLSSNKSVNKRQRLFDQRDSYFLSIFKFLYPYSDRDLYALIMKTGRRLWLVTLLILSGPCMPSLFNQPLNSLSLIWSIWKLLLRLEIEVWYKIKVIDISTEMIHKKVKSAIKHEFWAKSKNLIASTDIQEQTKSGNTITDCLVDLIDEITNHAEPLFLSTTVF